MPYQGRFMRVLLRAVPRLGKKTWFLTFDSVFFRFNPENFPRSHPSWKNFVYSNCGIWNHQDGPILRSPKETYRWHGIQTSTKKERRKEGKVIGQLCNVKTTWVRKKYWEKHKSPRKQIFSLHFEPWKIFFQIFHILFDRFSVVRNSAKDWRGIRAGRDHARYW